MGQIILFLSLIFLPFTSMAQYPLEKKNNGNNLVITTGYYRTNYHIAELTVGRGHTVAENILIDLSYYSAGAELLFDKDKTYLCPKISYEYDLLFISLKGNFLYVTNFTHDGYIVRPEIGLSFGGHVNLNYCYNINIANETALRQTHGIHLQWNFFPGGRNRTCIGC